MTSPKIKGIKPAGKVRLELERMIGRFQFINIVRIYQGRSRPSSPKPRLEYRGDTDTGLEIICYLGGHGEGNQLAYLVISSNGDLPGENGFTQQEKFNMRRQELKDYLTETYGGKKHSGN